jgi:hypothetical protein
MKKQLLFGLGFAISACSFAQQGMVKVPSNIANKAFPRNKEIIDLSPAASIQNVKQQFAGQKTSAFSENVLGKTFYDLQSNNSVGDRIWVNNDGSIAAVWTISGVAESATQYPTRGTGYVYFNGTTWSAQPTTRIETTRTGWPNVVNTRSGAEVIITHNTETATRNAQINRRAAKGTGAWTENTTAITKVTSPEGNFWPRMVGSGDTLYAISITTPSTSTQANTAYQGLNGAVTFHRSKDAGATWDIVNTVPTGLTSTDFRGFNGDSYAIACKGSTVAIVAGTEGSDVVMSKSTDAGTTWTSTRIYDFPLTLWDPATTISDINNDAVADTITTSDGSFAIAIDNTGKAHVSFGMMRILQTTPQEGFSYFPYTDGLIYWNETTGADMDLEANIVTGVLDRNGNSTLDIPAPASGLAMGRFGGSLSSMPSLAIDAAGVVYLSYSAIVEDLPSVPNSEKVVRHVYLMKSTDGGTNWSTPCDIMSVDPSLPYEGVYCSLAKNVLGGNLYMIYQRDLFPGFGVSNDEDASNLDQENEIVYFKISTSDIGNCASIDVSINEKSTLVNGVNLYPNPAANAATIEISLNEASKVDISIMNSVGQVLMTKQVNANSGLNKVSLDINNLSSGMYLYQVNTANSKSITKKFVVEK